LYRMLRMLFFCSVVMFSASVINIFYLLKIKKAPRNFSRLAICSPSRPLSVHPGF
jgi:hypothetical protein